MANPLRSSFVHRLRYYLRQFWLPIICVALAAVGLNRADAADADPKPLASAAVGRVTTPVFSVRRVPVALVTPLRGVLLAEPIRAAAQGLAGADSCQIVTNSALRVLYSNNTSTPLTPASNQKILTAYSALTLFGVDKKFRTQVVSDAPIDRGIVSGDLFLIGGGDPVLATGDFSATFKTQPQLRTNFESLADSIAAAGITRIRGGVVADATRYDDKRIVDSWPSRFVSGLQNPVGPLSALLVNDGFVDWPKAQDLSGSGPHTPARVPSENAAETLIILLRNRGVVVEGRVRSAKAPTQARILAAVDSPIMAEIVGQMLRESDNTTAELLLKEIGLARANAGTTAAGATAMSQLLTEKGLMDPGVKIVDGSGLDSGNRVTCALIARVLATATAASPVGTNLPIAGQSGTLADRFLGSPAKGLVQAKTGTLANASALGGFITVANNEKLVFVFISNGDAVDDHKPIEEMMASALLGFPGGPTLEQLGPKAP